MADCPKDTLHGNMEISALSPKMAYEVVSLVGENLLLRPVGWDGSGIKLAGNVVVKLLDLDPQGQWFDPWSGPDKICTAVKPLSKALNPTLLRGGNVSSTVV